eukprot:TRINITY_DN6372_c0_g2_i1.p1 TRINITY_DN6372_c0_g2~~TRINITY_DN6372_c0_g2_i1.p1  ORF type:complete len:202 (+),score=8.61 TRINITY_DN6372_c0_g2_i1:260-865(+)
MGLAYSSMTPFIILAHNSPADSPTHFVRIGRWYKTSEGVITGNITLSGTRGNVELRGKFANRFSNSFVYRASLSETLRKPDTERSSSWAKTLILYAIADMTYFGKNCSMFLESQWPDAPGPEPGAIIVEKYGEHYGILDNEGTKFVHNNPINSIVTYESIAVMRRYFKNGVVYKRYPDALDTNLFYQDRLIKELSESCISS